MRTGDLKTLVSLQAKSRTPDGKGGFTSTWITVASVWAAIWPLKGDEQSEGQQQGGVITHRVRIRFRKVIRSDWRFKAGNKYYHIATEPIDLGMNHEFLEMKCKEVVA